MRKSLSSACVVLMIVAAVWAQGQIATVTSSAPFTLRGAEITPGQGVATWPVMAGDTVEAGNSLTIVTFPDGSVATLNPGAQAKVDLVNGKPMFQLLKGTATYSLKSITAVQLMTVSHIVIPKSVAGLLGAGSSKAAAAGFWTAGHTAAVVAGGAAAATGLSVGIVKATEGGPR